MSLILGAVQNQILYPRGPKYGGSLNIVLYKLNIENAIPFITVEKVKGIDGVKSIAFGGKSQL